MIALYIYIAFSYLFMAPYVIMDWELRGKDSALSKAEFISAFVIAPISMPIVLGIDSKGGN